MKISDLIVVSIILAIVLLALAAGAIAGADAGARAARNALATIDGQRAEAQATFTDKNEVTVEFPALVRGRRVNCVVVANTQRKTQAIFC